LVNPLRHHRTIRTAEFSPDGLTIVTGSDDQSMRLWDVETGQPVSEPVRHRGEILAARFTGDGRSVMVGRGRSCCIYDLPTLVLPVQAWLPRLARALAGSLHDTGPGAGPATLFDLRSQSDGLPGTDATSHWRQWFFADRAERDLSPFTLPSYTTSNRVDLLTGLRDPESLREWVQRRPNDSLAWSWIIGTRDRGQLAPITLWRAAAEYQLQRLATSNPDDRVALWAALETWRVNDQLAAGIRWADGLIARWPGSINAWSAKGGLFQWAGRRDEAGEAFARALDLTRSDPRGAVTLRDSMLLNRASLLKRLGRPEEAQADYRSEWNIPSREPTLGDHVIDLSPYYNATLDEAWYDADAAGNRNLLPFRVGRHAAHEAFFDARGLLQFASQATVAAAVAFPDRAEGIPVQARVRRLHFLHGACGTDAPGRVLGTYVVHFDDGLTDAFPVVYGVHVLDRWKGTGAEPELPPESGFESRPNPAGEVVRLFHLRWPNPRPDVPIATVDFVSAGAAAAPFLVSLSWE
jgi:tetratricopeptide (TPR) repeat protein